MRNVGQMKKFIKEENDEHTVDEVEPPVVQAWPKGAKEMRDHPTLHPSRNRKAPIWTKDYKLK